MIDGTEAIESVGPLAPAGRPEPATNLMPIPAPDVSFAEPRATVLAPVTAPCESKRSAMIRWNEVSGTAFIKPPNMLCAGERPACSARDERLTPHVFGRCRCLASDDVGVR